MHYFYDDAYDDLLTLGGRNRTTILSSYNKGPPRGGKICARLI